MALLSGQGVGGTLPVKPRAQGGKQGLQDFCAAFQGNLPAQRAEEKDNVAEQPAPLLWPTKRPIALQHFPLSGGSFAPPRLVLAHMASQA